MSDSKRAANAMNQHELTGAFLLRVVVEDASFGSGFLATDFFDVADACFAVLSCLAGDAN